MAALQGPLAGIQVLDLSLMLLGPYSTQVLGEHTEEILREAGYQRGEIVSLLQSGTVQALARADG